MSKKSKILLISSICLVIVAILVTVFLMFFLPKNDSKITLNTPVFLNIQVQDGTKYLITDKNVLASGYAFYVYEGDEEPDNIYNYIKYESDTFYLDATDIIVNSKNYHFYCKYIGDDKYNDSDFTDIVTYSNKFNLETPQIVINGTEISWFNIENAYAYGVYANGSLIRNGMNNYTVKNQNYYDISSYVTATTIIDYEFFVVAFGDEQYNDSKFSNTVSYKNYQTLQKVHEISYIWDEKVLSWTPVDNASGYKILINNTTEIDTVDPTFDFSSLVPATGQISIQIKAVGQDCYKDSEYNNILVKTFEERLAAPKNMTYQLDDENIYVSWDVVDNASGYSVYVNSSLVNANVTGNGITLSKQNYEGKVIIQIMANGHGYYLSSAKITLTINL